MAPHQTHHPMQAALPADIAAARRRAIAAHPAGGVHWANRPVAASAVSVTTRVEPADRAGAESAGAARLPRIARAVSRIQEEQGAMAAEYGLLVVVGATICSLVIRWASGGAVFRLLDDILQSAGRLLGL